MSVNLIDIETAIHARLGTSTTGMVQGVYNTIGPSTASIKKGTDPYVVFTHVSGVADDTFTTNGFEDVYQVSIYAPRGDDSADARAVIDKVYGDSSGTDNAPTVGLHRYTLTGLAGSDDCIMVADRRGTLHTLTEYHWFYTFRVHIQEATP